MDGVIILEGEFSSPADRREAAPDFGLHGLVLETPEHGGLAREPSLRLRGLVEGGEDPVVAVRVRLNGDDLGRHPAETARSDVALTGFDAVLDVASYGCRLDVRLTAIRRSGATAQVKLLTIWRAAYRPERARIASLVVDYRADRGDPSRVSGRVFGAERPAVIEAWRAGSATRFPVAADGRFGGAVAGGGPDSVHLWARYEDGRADAYVGLALVGKRPSDDRAASFDLSDGAAILTVRGKAGDWSGEGARAVVNGRLVTLAPEPGRAGALRMTPKGWGGALPDHLVFEGRPAGGGWVQAESWNLTGAPLRTVTAASAAAKAVRADVEGERRVLRVVRVNPSGEDLVAIVRDPAGPLEAIPFSNLDRIAVADDVDFAHDLSAAPDDDVASFLKALPKPGYRVSGVERLDRAVTLPVRGLKDPPDTIDRVLLVCPGRHATDDIYVRRPLDSVLAARGLALEIVDLSEGGEAAAGKLERPLKAGAVVIVSRQANDAWIELLSRAPRGVFVVYLMDDDPPSAADSPGLPPRYRQRMCELATTDFQALLRLCDRFVVAAPAMAERYASPKTVLMEPPLIREPLGLAHFDDLRTVRVAYHGTDVHKDDIGFLYEPLARALSAVPSASLQVISAVKPPASLGRLPNFERVAPMAWADYAAFSRENPAHLNLAPLLDTPFNRGKSMIKVLDSASLGAAGVYSRTAPYDAVVTDRRDGVLVDNDPALWERTLTALLSNPLPIRAMAEEGLRTAREIGSLSRCAAQWRDLLGL